MQIKILIFKIKFFIYFLIMLKKSESEDDDLRLNYTYIKQLLAVNQLLISEVPDKESIKVKKRKK